MWEDYAKKRGISTAAMTQAQRVEAEYLGIQQETAAMTGDLASLQDTLSGKMAKAENQAYLLSKALGEANTQLKAAETDLKNGLLQGLTELVQTFPGVTAGATTATGAFVGMMAAVPVLKKVVELWKSLQVTIKTAKVSMGTLGWVALGLGAVTTAFTAYKNHLEKVAQEEEKRIQQNKDAVKAQQDRIDTMKALINRYVELKRKQSITYREAVELKSIENDLATQYGITKDQVDELAQSTDTYTTSIKNLTQAEREKLLGMQELQTEDYKIAAEKAVQSALDNLNALKFSRAVDYENYKLYGTGNNEFIKNMKEFESQVDTAFAAYQDYVNSALNDAKTEAELAGENWKDTVATALTAAMLGSLDLEQLEQYDVAGNVTGYLDEQIAMISDAASSPEIAAAIDNLQRIWDQAQAGATEIDFSGMEQSIRQIDVLWETLKNDLNMSKEDFIAAVSPINYLVGGLDDLKISLKATAKGILEARSFTVENGNAANEVKDRYTELKDSVDAYYELLDNQAAMAANIQKWREMVGQLQNLQEAFGDIAEAAKDNNIPNSFQVDDPTIGLKGWQNLNDQMTDVKTESDVLLANMKAVALELGVGFDGTDKDLENTSKSIDTLADGFEDAANDIESTRQTLQSEIKALYDQAETDTDKLTLWKMFVSIDGSEGKTQTLEAFGDLFDQYRERFESGLDALKDDACSAVNGSWSDELADGLSIAMQYALGNMGIEDPEIGEQIVTALIDSIAAAASDEAMADAMETITAFTETIQKGIVPDAEQVDAFMEAWETMFGEDSPIITGLQGLVESGKITAEQMEEQKESILGWLDPLNLLGDTVEETAAKSDTAASLFGDAANEMSDAEKAFKNYQKTMKDIQSDLKVTSSMVNQIKAWKDLYKAYQKAKDSAGDVKKAIRDLTPIAKKMNSSFDGSAEAIEGVNDAFNRMSSFLPQQMSALQNEAASLEWQLWLLDNTDPDVTMTGDASILKGELDDVLEQIEALIAYAAENGIDLSGFSSGGGGGGGRKHAPSGGGGGPSQSAYDKEIDHLEHLKALDQLTYEQELENLEDISRRRIADAEERLDLEERIFDVKKSIAERDAENLTDLTEAIMDALEERYDSMREAELETLEQSRDAWEEWRDHNVSAIQEQIDALDALEEAEDNEADRQEHLRKIAMLEQNLAYEQDTYNQMQLQKKLDAAREDYDDFLSDLAREEQKAELEAAMDEINQKADSEIDALDQQQEAVEAYYDARMEQANLQAEAELALVNSTQQQIIDLLTAYAPDYDAAGRTLGEKLMEGFTSVVGTFNDWFSDFESKVTTAVDSLQAANKAAASGREQTYDEYGNPVSGITIEQTNNFNTPVETPAETARRIQQANEDLAEQIAGE